MDVSLCCRGQPPQAAAGALYALPWRPGLTPYVMRESLRIRAQRRYRCSTATSFGAVIASWGRHRDTLDETTARPTVWSARFVSGSLLLTRD